MKIFIVLLAMVMAIQAQTLEEFHEKAKQQKTKGEFHMIHDRFTDQATIMTKPYNLVSSASGIGTILGSHVSRDMGGRSLRSPIVLLIGLETSYVGKTLTEPPAEFDLVFTSKAETWAYLHTDPKLYILLDGTARIILEQKAMKTDTDASNDSIETIRYAISRDDVQRMANAKKAEIRLGERPRTLPDKLLKRFKAFLDLIPAPSARSSST